MERGTMIAMLGIAIFLFVLLMVALITVILLGRKKVVQPEYTITELEDDIGKRQKAFIDVIAPDGIEPNPYPYLVVDDCGTQVFIRGFSIESLPKNTKFATTLRPLITYPKIDTSIFVTPESEDRTKKKLDKHITVLDGEQSTAYKNKDRNRIRSLQGQLDDTEQWVSRIEEGYDKFYLVRFLFVLKCSSLKELNSETNTFYRLAKKNSIGISATYAAHPEAFVSGGPFGKPMNGKGFKLPLKEHYLSRGAVADVLFNHISSDFRHKDGVPLGRTFDLKPVLFTPFSETHVNGYGMIIAGETGCGKTTMVKALAKRLQNTTGQYRFAIIDSQKRGNRGEYSSLADDLNGVCHQFMHNSKNIINLCEVSDQLEYDEILKSEYRALHLAERKSMIVDNLMMLVQGSKSSADFKIGTYLERVISDVVDESFEERRIYDGDVESLYTEGTTFNDLGEKVTVKKKKELPTISSIYRKLMERQHKDPRHEEAVGLILDSLKDYVHFLAYVEVDGRYIFLKESMIGKGTPVYTLDGKTYPVQIIRGRHDYFDGQSTIEFSTDCVCTNFDISGLPKSERPKARQIVMSFITEEFSKNNSMNFHADSSDKLVTILDECHENYPYPYMRRSIDNAYRTQRKRHCSTWICQQALSDGSQYEEIAQGVIANTAVLCLFKQPHSDREFLKKHTILNDRQIEEVISIGMPEHLSEDPDEAKEEIKSHLGECCLIDGGKAVFMKVDVMMHAEAELIASNKKTLDELYQQTIA